MTATESSVPGTGDGEQTQTAASKGTASGKSQIKGRTIRKCRTQKSLDPLQLLSLVVVNSTADGVDLGKLSADGNENGQVGTRAGSKFLCTICGSTFGRRCELKRHIGEVHMINGGRRFRCTHPSCVKSFTRKDALVKHNAVKHQGKRRFICPTCSEKFTSRYDLSRHGVRVHSSVKKRFTCEFCNAGFSQKSQLTMHKGRVHSPRSHNSSVGMSCSTTGSISCESRIDSDLSLSANSYDHKASGIDSLATVAAALVIARDSGSGVPQVDASKIGGGTIKARESEKEAESVCYGAEALLTAAAALQPASFSEGHENDAEDAESKCTSGTIGWSRSMGLGSNTLSDCYSMDSDKA